MYFNDTDRDAYRSLHSGLIFSRVAAKESDLHVGAEQGQAEYVWREAQRLLPLVRAPLEAYVNEHPEFAKSLSPVPELGGMPPIVQRMARAAKKCGVGPMAAVAGAVADILAQEMPYSGDLIIENGGDIFMRTSIERKVLIYAGKSPLSGKLALSVPPGCYGICTSSATVGPALSFGNADAALIIAKDATLADASASTLGNAVKAERDIEAALELVIGISGVRGALVIIGGAFGAKGEISLLRA